jgi:hypothetical protein
MKIILACLSIGLILSSCPNNEPVEETPKVYNSIKMQPEQDSLFLSANGETRQFNLIGSIINVSEKTMTNSGAMVDAKYTVRQIDTSFESIDVSKVTWKSSNNSIATVSNGLVRATTNNTTSGTTIITAQIGNAISKSMIVNVRGFDIAPGLSLNPPEVSLIFENKIEVTGNIQDNAWLRVIEPNSGFLKDSIQYQADGSFGITVTGLNQGIRTITARATHFTKSYLNTERTKSVIYYAPGSSDANKIVGNWLGTTLGKDFNFKIENSIIPTRYDITGKLDIQFGGLGLVKDINLIGIVNNNGTFDIALSKTEQGLTISGKMNGRFQSVGSAEGEYSAKAEKSGWPTLSAGTTWTAVKIP